MSIIICPECRGEVSRKAKKCIHCGCPLNRNKRTNRMIGYIITFFLTLIVGGFLLFYFCGTEISLKPRSLEQADSSVVTVICYDKDKNEVASGSGFIAFNSHTIVTNYHVAECGRSFEIVDLHDNKYIVDHIEYANKAYDIAILYVSNEVGDLSVLGNSDKCRKGDKVFAIGAPLGLSNTVSDGVISGFITDPEMGGITILQTSAPISQGSSGGVLLNKSYKVIGVTFAGMEDGQNINFAIPINIVRDAYNNRTAEDRRDTSALYFEKYPYQSFAEYRCEEGYIDLDWNGYGDAIVYSSLLRTSDYEKYSDLENSFLRLQYERQFSNPLLVTENTVIVSGELHPGAYVKCYKNRNTERIDYVEVMD